MSLLINNFNNFVLNYISKKYQLDSYGYQLLSSVMVSATTYIEQQNITNCEFDIYGAYADSYQYYPYVFGIVIGMLCIKMLYKGYQYICLHFSMSTKYKMIIIENEPIIYKELLIYMKNNKNYFTTSESSLILKNGTRSYLDHIPFNDNSFESNGYVEFKANNMAVIYIQSSFKFKNESYLDHILDSNEQYVARSKTITLEYYKYLQKDFIKNTIFEGSKIDLEIENTMLYKTYFSQYKYLIDLFTNGSIGCNNLMCYGSPGVGKSRFIYLCSRMMNCNIYSIDLSQYINNKTLLMKMFHGMKFKITDHSNSVPEMFTSNTKCIIALDEFDFAIEKIIANSTQHELNDRKKQSQGYPEEPKFNRLELSDLLELFQGSVPMPNRYIIANTNSFHKINNLIPALFRPGRMTSIEFKHITWDILNEITMHYYEQEMTHKPLNITIPTSMIIEEIQNYKQMQKSFDEFEQHLINLLEASL